MINLHQLTVFAAVVELGSFTRAAEHLHLTQPAVSAQVRHLRAFARGAILTREGRRVVPTEAGAALYAFAREVLGASEALHRDLGQIASGELERIVVGGTRAYATYVLPAILSRFHVRHRALRLSLVDAGSEELFQRVRAGEIDVAVVLAGGVSTRLDQRLGAVHLCDDELIVVESAEHPFSHDGTLSAEEAANLPFVRTLLDRATQGATTLDHLLSGAGLGAHRVVMELPTWEGTKQAVLSGVGLAIAVRSAVITELNSRQLRTVRVEGYKDSRSVALITSPHRRRIRQSTAFEELLAFLGEEVPRSIEQTTENEQLTPPDVPAVPRRTRIARS